MNLFEAPRFPDKLKGDPEGYETRVSLTPYQALTKQCEDLLRSEPDLGDANNIRYRLHVSLPGELAEHVVFSEIGRFLTDQVQQHSELKSELDRLRVEARRGSRGYDSILQTAQEWYEKYVLPQSLQEPKSLTISVLESLVKTPEPQH